MSFVEAVRSVYGNYAKFDGRALRSEFWWFVLFYVLVSVVVIVVASIGGIRSTTYTIGLVGLAIFGLLTLIPYLAVSVRRLHDTNRSGWWLLLSFVPFGSLVLLIMFALDGTPGPNKYGPDPKGRPGYGWGQPPIGAQPPMSDQPPTWGQPPNA
jgi:uncharacterized membrane protein YhaH (DUF805 family)